MVPQFVLFSIELVGTKEFTKKTKLIIYLSCITPYFHLDPKTKAFLSDIGQVSPSIMPASHYCWRDWRDVSTRPALTYKTYLHVAEALTHEQSMKKVVCTIFKK